MQSAAARALPLAENRSNSTEKQGTPPTRLVLQINESAEYMSAPYIVARSAIPSVLARTASIVPFHRSMLSVIIMSSRSW